MQRVRRRRHAGWALGLALCGACGSGHIGSVPAPGEDGGAAGPDVPTSVGFGDGGACMPGAPALAPLRRMTRAEYNNTVHDLLHTSLSPADDFAPDEVAGVFSNDAASLIVSPLLAEQYLDAAEALAVPATRDLPTLMACDPTHDEHACVVSFVGSFGLRAWRRPLTAAESARFVALYDGLRASQTLAASVQGIVEAALLSPYFLYRPEFGAGAPSAGGGVALAPYEMASRLSYFLWESMPDATLFDAAANQQLASASQLETQARRMLADPRARGVVRRFHDEWLGLDDLVNTDKDPTVFPAWTPAVANATADEAHALVDDIVWSGDGRLATLLTASYTFLTPGLATLYHLPAPSDPTHPARVELDPTQRAGLLTLPALMAVDADGDDTTPRAPIVRGRMIRERILCQQIPDPPPDVPNAPDRMAGATRREQLAAHRVGASCAGCHDLLDPIGLGFEHYDAIGRFVTTEAGRAVDSSGTVTGSNDVDGDFTDAVALAHRLSQSDEVRDCVTTQWFRYAFGRQETEADICSLTSARAAFAAHDHDVRELLVGLVTSDAFAHRPPVAH